MQKTLLLLLSVLINLSCVTEQKSTPSTAHLNLTPHPQYVALKGGDLDLSKGLNFTTTINDSLSGDMREYLNEWITFDESTNAKLEFIIDSAFSSNKEGYLLVIDSRGVMIKASHFGGLFYGVQTLKIGRAHV